nr:probable calcium-binding protein CML18 [Ipomoea batatas]
MAKSGSDPKAAVISGGAMAEVEKVFRKFDSNGDGKISLSELGAILNALGSKTSAEEVKRIMLEVDTDGDGFIDMEEFAAFHCSSDGGSDSEDKDLRDAFNLYDKDKNGKISASELHSVMKSLGENTVVTQLQTFGTRDIYPVQLELHFTALNVLKPNDHFLDNLVIFPHDVACFREAVCPARFDSSDYTATGNVLRAHLQILHSF